MMLIRTILCAAAFAAPLLTAVEASAGDPDGKFMVRARGILVEPDEGASLNVPGADVDIDTAIMPELDLTYFFTPNIAAELILATTPHEIDGKGAIAGADVGDVWLLPPTLTLQYHAPLGNGFKPYVGAGVNYTIFYNEDAGQFNDIDYDDSFGFALQAGVDYEFGNGWLVNADVKKLWLSTDVSINNGAVTGEVDIDPWIFGLGVGYRF